MNRAMIDALLTLWFRWLGGTPCFRVYGKGRREARWRILDVYATHRRDSSSRWPLCRGTCITWTSRVIVVGWDFAEELLREQITEPASRTHAVEVAGGRLNDLVRRAASGTPNFATASEVLAHECGHTWQVLRLRDAYLPLVGSVTLFREGPRFWNHFENQASEEGQFGGLVNGSVCTTLMERVFRK
jgi:hypothetical protein